MIYFKYIDYDIMGLDGLSDGPNNIYKISFGENKFPIEKILNPDLKIPKISIKKVPLNVDFRSMPVFELLIKIFNHVYEKNYSFDEILYSKSRFRAFYDFVFYLTLSGKLEISPSEVGNFIMRLNSLQQEYNQNSKSVEKYYDEIIEKVYYPKGLTKKDNEVKYDMYYFESAYSMVKLVFKDLFRDDLNPDNERIRYFEHLKGTMEIVLRELPNPNIYKIVVSLLHDIIEDVKGFTVDILRYIYGDRIADGVKALSKKPRISYLNKEQNEEYHNLKLSIDKLLKQIKLRIDSLNGRSNSSVEQIDLLNYMTIQEKTEYQKLQSEIFKYQLIGKEKRNQDYFGHLDDLDEDTLDDKFADRIHNLRTMQPYSKEKINKKIVETEKYFLEVAKNKNIIAYNLLVNELEKLKNII